MAGANAVLAKSQAEVFLGAKVALTILVLLEQLFLSPTFVVALCNAALEKLECYVDTTASNHTPSMYTFGN